MTLQFLQLKLVAESARQTATGLINNIINENNLINYQYCTGRELAF